MISAKLSSFNRLSGWTDECSRFRIFRALLSAAMVKISFETAEQVGVESPARDHRLNRLRFVIQNFVIRTHVLLRALKELCNEMSR